MDTEYVYIRSNNNSQVDEQTDYSQIVNKSKCDSYEESQPTLEPLSIT